MAPDAGLPRRCDPACSTCTRLRSALLTMLAGRAWDDLTAASIADAAGLDVIVFPEHYPSVAACGADALDRAARDCLDACADAYLSWQGCAERFFGLSGTVLRWVETRPGLAPLLFVVPEQTREPALVARVGAFKRELAGLFDRPGRCTPAGRTHVEFVIGLFFQAGYQHLTGGTEAGSLRDRVLSLAPFVEPPSYRTPARSAPR